MERALIKQRMGIIQKQVAVGREFKVHGKIDYCIFLVSTFVELQSDLLPNQQNFQLLIFNDVIKVDLGILFFLRKCDMLMKPNMKETTAPDYYLFVVLDALVDL